MVALLPLHTFFIAAWISWKPYLVLVVVIAAWQAIAGLRQGSWPWHRPASIGLALMLFGALISWPGSDYASRFSRLLLALGVGGAVMLVTVRCLEGQGMWRRTLQTVFWSGAVMVATAIIIELATTGALGDWALNAANDWPGVRQVTKAAYLEDGFVALTNWHQDPGYSAAWTNLWLALSIIAVVRGLGSRRLLIDTAVIGGLGVAVILTFSRTGWIGLGVALVATSVALLLGRETSIRRLGRLLGYSVLSGMILLGILWLVDPADVGGDIGDAVAFRLEQNLSLGPGPSGDATTDPGLDLVDYRGEVWPQYVDFFEEDPLRGAGLGVGWQTPGLQEPHNLALQLLGETGLIGLAGFLALGAIVLWYGGGLVGAVALIVAFSASITQTVLFEPTWWFAAGLFLAGKRRTSTARSGANGGAS
ncbi:MAG: O-antigen ligase family protein [Acidimicrobiia bacterium]